ncbi:hypothetical protein GCM10023188_05330 [Pontibacter saemangeumensis]|uniref:Uncharacterized protein n=1 Tax=Pontibacter saemangeumensis TaxID=1084525 RepID=A0ABP8LAN6_9BACT
METSMNDLKNKAARINPEHREGPVASIIEEQTAKIPSDVYLWAAIGSIAASLAFKIMKQEKNALFVGQWAPTFLLLGNYNKMVKLLGHDSKS